jgi:hypothetical protein
MLSSGKHKELTTDRKPWITRRGALLVQTDRYRYETNVNGVLEFEPRNKLFVPRPLANAANPILEAFRRNTEDFDTEMEEQNFDDVLFHWVWYLTEGMQEVSWDPEHYRHAWLVIGRLANLRGVR